ncbi:MAG TPA: ABC transporter permease [Acidimicrobiales bacterium]|nr:ABC transporter permease [Acidimicrobiales bacterium]
MSLPVEVLTGAVRGGTSILYAAVGESVSETAGVVNLGTEGSMLVGALAAYAVTANTGNPWVGAAAGAAAGAALALVHAYFVLQRRSNQLATGLVVLFLGLGVTSLFGAAYVSREVNSFKPWAVPLLSKIPWVGEILFHHDPLTYLTFLLVPAAWFVLRRTGIGLLVRGAGERSEVLATYGHNVRVVQYLAVVTGGLLAGVGGAQLSTAYANAWFENMTQGRGFVAVAVVIFAARKPLAAMGGSYLFGAALALSPALQARGFAINQFALDSLPYLTVILVLVLLGRKRAAQAPEGLQKVFELSTS